MFIYPGKKSRLGSKSVDPNTNVYYKLIVTCFQKRLAMLVQAESDRLQSRAVRYMILLHFVFIV